MICAWMTNGRDVLLMPIFVMSSGAAICFVRDDCQFLFN